MGIPFYFKTIVRQHSTIVQPVSRLGKRCDRLFLDFNCAIHQCAQAVLRKHAASPLPQAELEASILREILLFLQSLVKLIQPKVSIVIAVDGVCPLAKMVQQRKRRFVSQWKNSVLQREAERLKVPLCLWDSNAITPGTAFMDKLNEALHGFVKQQNQENGRGKPGTPPLWVLSDSQEAGEGEHKIMDWLRRAQDPAAQQTLRPNGKDVIYGLDADLIMLSMISPASDRICLLREKPAFDIAVRVSEAYLTLDIAQLKASLQNEIQEMPVADYVALCWLIGNDFIPPLTYLKIKRDGIELLRKTYLEAGGGRVQPLVLEDQGLNPHLFAAILERLAREEDARMDEVSSEYYQRMPRLHERFQQPLDAVQSKLDNLPLLQKFPPCIDTSQKSWRLDYYKHLFKAQPSPKVQDLCINYLEGILWTYLYYFKGPAHVPQTWCYPHNYSPTALDLTNHIVLHPTWSSDLLVRLQNLPAADIPSSLQLLYVSPPHSKHLLPESLRALVTDIDRGCVHYFPHAFQICTYLKTYLWEASPVLPLVDFAHLMGAANVKINVPCATQS